jgi:hypothetical protein
LLGAVTVQGGAVVNASTAGCGQDVLLLAVERHNHAAVLATAAQSYL